MRVIYLATGSIYEGQWKNGKANGFGRFINAKSNHIQSYIGWFEDSKFMGYGYLMGSTEVKDGLFENH